MTTTSVAGVMEAADAYPKAKVIPYTPKRRCVVCSLSHFAKASGVMLALGVLTVLAGRAQSVSDNGPVAPYPAVANGAGDGVAAGVILQG
jgi:hypothetical protein